MWNKKRVGLILFISLFLLTIIPVAFAAFEFLYGFNYMDFDLVDFYFRNHGLFDPIVIGALLALLFQFFLPKQFGEDEKRGYLLDKISWIIGAVAGLSLTFGFRNFGDGNGIVLGLWPVWLFMLVLTFLVFVYKSIKGEEKIPWPVIAALVLFTLLLAAIFLPTIFGPLASFIFGNAIAATAAAILMIIGLISLLRWGGRKIAGVRSDATSPGDPSDRTTPRGSDRAAPIGSRKPPIHRIIIGMIPVGPYRPGNRIRFIAQPTIKRRFRPERADTSSTFACRWVINGIEDHGQHGTEINWEVPREYAVATEQVIQVEVYLTDTQEAGRNGRGNTEITIRGGIPNLIITNPINTNSQNSLVVDIREEVDFSFIMDQSNGEPQGMKGANWYFIPKRFTEIKKATLKGATAFGESDSGNTFQCTIGEDPLPLGEGIYTIICVALDEDNNPYVLPVINKLLEAHFTLTVKKGSAAPPKINAEIIVSKDREGKNIISKGKSSETLDPNEDYWVHADVTQSPATPQISCNTKWIIEDMARKKLFESQKAWHLELTADPRRAGTQERLTLTVLDLSENVITSQQMLLNYSKVPGTNSNEPKITVVRINNVSINKGMVVPIALDQETIFEIAIEDPRKEINENIWYIDDGTGNKPLSRATSATNKITFSGANYSPKDYKISVVAANNGTLIKDSNGDYVSDFVIIRLVGFVVDQIFKDDIKNIKNQILVQKGILDNMGIAIKSRDASKVKNLADLFKAEETALKSELTAILDKAGKLKQSGQIDEFMQKAVGSWAERVSNPKTTGAKNNLPRFIDFILKYMQSKEYDKALNVLEGTLLGTPDPTQGWLGGLFLIRINAMDEISI